MAGKWRQLSHFTTKEDGAKWGFDEFLIWGAGTPDDDDAPADKAAKKARRAAGEPKAKGDRYWSPDYNLNGRLLKDADQKYGPDVLHEFVVDFIKRHKEGPCFVYYPMPLIHGPILATPDSKQSEGDVTPSFGLRATTAALLRSRKTLLARANRASACAPFPSSNGR